jgi:hypothetical protein
LRTEREQDQADPICLPPEQGQAIARVFARTM